MKTKVSYVGTNEFVNFIKLCVGVYLYMCHIFEKKKTMAMPTAASNLNLHNSARHSEGRRGVLSSSAYKYGASMANSLQVGMLKLSSINSNLLKRYLGPICNCDIIP